MKQTIKHTLLALAALVVCTPLFLTGYAAAAGTATLYFSPASGSVVQGATLTVNVYEDSGSDTVNAVQANFSYPSALLTYTGTTNSSAFGIEAETSGGGGNVRLGRGTISAVTGPQIVATVSFTAAASSGTAGLSFVSGSSVVRSSDNQPEALTTQAGSYTLSAPAAPPPSGSGSGSGGSASSSKPPTSSKPASSSTPATSTPSTATASSGALTITGIQVLNLSATTASISWKTSVPATSIVDYGLTTRYGQSAINDTLATDHTLALDSKNLAPGKVFHFIVKSVDGSANAVASTDMTFATPLKIVAPAAKNTSGVWMALGVIVLLGALGAVGLLAMQRMRGNQPPGASGGSSFKPPPSSTPPAPPADKIIAPTTPPAPKA